MAFTYLIYIFILIGATLSAYLYENTLGKYYNKIFYFFSFLIPFFFLATRYDTGEDYANYVVYFQRIAEGNIPLKEPLYIAVNYIISIIGLDVQWLFVFFAFFTTYFVYKSLPKGSFAIGVFLFISIYYLYDCYDIMRQGLGSAIIAYAITNTNSKKSFFFYMLLAFGFHAPSAILVSILYPLLKHNFNKYTYIILILYTFVAVLQLNVIEKIISLFIAIFPQYSWYLNSEFILNSSKIGTGIGIIFKIALFLFIAFNKNKFIKNYEQKKNNLFKYVFFIYFIYDFENKTYDIFKDSRYFCIWTDIYHYIFYR